MRILTWNVNGWRKIKTYQPFHGLSTWPRILAYLQADVICLQETKLTRKQALEERTMLLPEDGKWDSVWDFHPSRGYSGTVVYWKKEVTGHPEKAELGVTGRKGITPATVSSYTTATPIGGFPATLQDSLEDHPEDATIFHRLDEEGRGVVVDFGLFVLFNLYCPVGGNESRADFREAFYAALNERSRKLLEQGREVIIVGDINIARQPIDHCDASDPAVHSVARAEYYLSSKTRTWLNSFCHPIGPFHDVQRDIFPERLGMYTCWSQLINARPANYGTRIDYTLVSPGLRDWVKGADIQQEVPGSDHCPAYVDFYDEREIDGKLVRFKDLLSNAASSPALATSRWEELNRRDLKSFFAGGATKTGSLSQEGSASPVKRSGSSAAIYQPPPRPGAASRDVSASPVKSQASSGDLNPTPLSTKESESLEASELPTAQGSTVSSSTPGRPPSLLKSNAKTNLSKATTTVGTKKNGVKQGKSEVDTASSTKKPKQLKLGSFFVAPSAPARVSPPAAEAVDGTPASGSAPTANSSEATVNAEQSQTTPSPVKSDGKGQIQEEEVDWAYLYSLPDPDAPATTSTHLLRPSGSPSTSKIGSGSSSSWSSLFSAPPPPRCQVHKEEATSYTVNKRDAKNNFGRKFWLCSRPVGPGYEKKWSERKAEGEPGREYRCGYFVWNSDWEAEHRKRKGAGKRESGASEALELAAQERERKKGKLA
ncbi:DNase I-like protein [Microstroma glucosiphilum]|uniref:DNA-(apurinic or apyrimidinic site) endonuclease n=1 Tax=Pseudomicrostroma glucosiphilum TaxID=1684307 RepID=A0A316U6S9_9BASI|nr:DNase I-like protein [Pseudomicrostroma glucosiphilum]PWN20141.1 DNase I-like protein [Pseudomicrostroma glucosiphilum]